MIYLELLEQAQNYAKEFDEVFQVNQLLGVRQELLNEEIDELFEADAEDNIVEVFDALADIAYVAGGILNVGGVETCKLVKSKYLFLLYGSFEVFYGINSRSVFFLCISECLKEVHRSNLTKLEGGKPLKRSDGKILKGSEYERPNLKPILERYDVM